MSEVTLTPIPGYTLLIGLAVAAAYSAGVLRLLESPKRWSLRVFWVSFTFVTLVVTLHWMAPYEVRLIDFLIWGTILLMALSVPTLGAIQFAEWRIRCRPRAHVGRDLLATTLLFAALVPVGFLAAVFLFGLLARIL